MNTFLPYSDFRMSAHCLDPDRLGNQVYRECKTLVKGGWPNHPASKMWREHLKALCMYSLNCLEELFDRGRYYKAHIDWFVEQSFKFPDTGNPKWLGDDEFHSRHRSILLFKNYEWYKQFNWKENPMGPDENGKWPYIWPI